MRRSVNTKSEVTECSVRSVFSECGLLNVRIHETWPYAQAFAHPSKSADEGLALQNQRLEFLGDAVLDLATAAYAFELFPDDDEGVLTTVRQQLVNRQSLARFSRCLGLDAFLGATPSDRILADTFEALIAARYVDVLTGTNDIGLAYAETTTFVRAVIDKHGLDLCAVIQPFKSDNHFNVTNFKGHLNVVCLKYANKAPVYSCVGDREVNGVRHWTMKVDTPVFDVTANATATTKLGASHKAAAIALSHIRKAIKDEKIVDRAAPSWGVM
ncbi:hypothetical protein CTAYLR_007854 [Chrysophaeum taylorii]|uniref:RNase III domain-containing protein n=1 Tax=Chrysophaeum taylorii TaxID=2483200 RepID=A0AAD7UCH6_9STRA|nr:hypothetical protein CTAYLR_007854 [Chrysophaeum taylorii]